MNSCFKGQTWRRPQWGFYSWLVTTTTTWRQKGRNVQRDQLLSVSLTFKFTQEATVRHGPAARRRPHTYSTCLNASQPYSKDVSVGMHSSSWIVALRVSQRWERHGSSGGNWGTLTQQHHHRRRNSWTISVQRLFVCVTTSFTTSAVALRRREPSESAPQLRPMPARWHGSSVQHAWRLWPSVGQRRAPNTRAQRPAECVYQLGWWRITFELNRDWKVPPNSARF